MLLFLWGWFRLDKGIWCPEHLDECLVVGSGFKPPTSILPLRGTLNTEPGWGFLCVGRQVCDVCLLSLWVWVQKPARLCGGLGGAHLWLEVGVAVEQW